MPSLTGCLASATNIYTLSGQRDYAPAMRWASVGLGGSVASGIMIFATLAEFSYIPKNWTNTSHLTARLIFLTVTFALTLGPFLYISHGRTIRFTTTARILGYVEVAIAFASTAFYSIVPSGRMFGDRVRGKARKYLASQTFTASYPRLTRQERVISLALWVLVFGCKFVESYFFLTLSFENPIRVMVGMRIQNCNDKVLGDNLCRFQPVFALTTMFIMDIVLFFLDTFLWYVIWNTVFS